jgi:T-complex protein 1 subunit alpha
MLGARHSDVFFGERESGKDVRQNNATAVQAVANIVKSSLGPVGLDKVRRRRRSSSCDFDF